ncbi:MAG: hypothetical protein KTR32_06680 [Granulosicoccus sp.]|nr:hypothetical protein [Granulosicoccus sp.]
MPGLVNRLLALDVQGAIKIVSARSKAMQAQGLAIELETNPLLAWADENLVHRMESETQIGDNKHAPDKGLYAS